MEPGPSYLINVVVIVLVLMLAVLFTLTEYALVRVRVSALRALKEGRNGSTRLIDAAIHMTENLTEYLSTAQVGITLTSLILGWIGEVTIADAIVATGILPANVAQGISSIIAILLFTVIHAVFTDLVPKNIAIADPVKILLFIVRPVRFFHIVLYPLIFILDRTANLFTHLLGYPTAADEDIYSQNEILSLSKNAAKAGELDEEDLTFMERAFDMNDKVAVDIMVDRTSMCVVDVDTTIHEALEIYIQERYSRLPIIADGDKDKVIGYVYTYDLIRQGRINDSEPVVKIMRDIPAVPENMDVHDVLKVMVAKRAPITIVVDEYGGTSGLITDKDIYEELFGSVRDEIDDVADDYIQKLGNYKYKVSGKVSLYDLERYFDVNIKDFEEDEAVTLTGYVLNHEPDFRTGDVMHVANFEIKALDYDNAYINEFEITKLAPEINEDIEE
ncbi:hemolysin family protein [Periweissella fabalis]|uniref:HlyC/CorC family transporter n=1 Tax=Periweissella fabalis TaxID=1070421 RepID=A0A7X6S3F1_9LACO|nr:hemolysin family protein [Periweissella fabalis]MCM0598577.1 HlyC/CorC family transporter [Periweissella fabalis]NKZ24141.1 HlyC/CorC family transporter [Periweissella fabalis]